jgi:hypothetical protein
VMQRDRNDWIQNWECVGVKGVDNAIDILRKHAMYLEEIWPSKLVHAITLLICIRKLLASNVGREIEYPDCGFPQSPCKNCRIMPYTRTQPLTFQPTDHQSPHHPTIYRPR